MIKYVIIVSALAMSGCSSTPTQTASSQYCFTTKNVELTNGETVSSKVQVSCSDDPTTRYLPAKVGLSPQCGWSKQYVKKGNGYVETAFVSCRRPDGVWEVPATQ
jgi:hypothetical protein